MKFTYYPQIFDVTNIQTAREIILTPEGDTTTDDRWVTETPYLADLIHQTLEITPETVLIDYGCGIGRVAKELITRYGCQVIGVDISTNMRALSVDYVRSNRFISCSPEMLDTLTARKFVADAAFSIWVLQHCFAPIHDVERIKRAVAPGGGVFVLNATYRAVPTNEGWVDDGTDVKELLTSHFSLLDQGRPLDEKIAPNLRERVFWASLRNTV